MTVSQWADRYRIVPPGTSPEPGAWRTDRVPYLREILDAFSDPTIERVYVQAASQVAKSEVILNVIGYHAHQEPSPILLVQANEMAMRGFSKERVAPMFAASPVLRGKLREGERDPSNTIMLRQFPGGLLACAFAGSAASLASRPIRVVLADEIDRWPDSTGRDGEPFAQAVQRTSNFHNRKIGAVSTPTITGFSAIARLYEDSDQRHYHVPCLRCGAYQVLQWKSDGNTGIIYKRDGVVDLDDVHYLCAICGGRMEERDRPEMLRRGEWKPEREHPYRGYQISALYSPWVRWRELVVEWLRAHKDRDKRGKQEFVNLRLGETWDESTQQISIEALEKNRDEYPAELPDGVLMLSAAVDVQDNRLEVEVVGWGVGKESWGIEYSVIGGDTSTDGPWARLDEYLQRSWSKEDGRGFTIWCTCIDSGGHRTNEVYDFCKTRDARYIRPIKGYAGTGRPIVGKPNVTGSQRVLLYPVGVDTAKEALFSRLALPERGAGFCHFPIGRGYDDQYFLGLVSEKLVARGGKLVWEKFRARNEPLDVRVYATAAMEMCGPDFSDLAAKDAEAKKKPPGGGGTGAPLRRRVLSKGVE